MVLRQRALLVSLLRPVNPEAISYPYRVWSRRIDASLGTGGYSDDGIGEHVVPASFGS